jgi:hypothetical protein
VRLSTMTNCHGTALKYEFLWGTSVSFPTQSFQLTSMIGAFKHQQCMFDHKTCIGNPRQCTPQTSHQKRLKFRIFDSIHFFQNLPYPQDIDCIVEVVFLEPRPRIAAIRQHLRCRCMRLVGPKHGLASVDFEHFLARPWSSLQNGILGMRHDLLRKFWYGLKYRCVAQRLLKF